MGDQRPRLFVTSVFDGPRMPQHLGLSMYSYRIVAQAFRPLLERWAPTEDVIGPPAALDRALAAARAAGHSPIHISFLPPHAMPFSREAPNVGVPAWEFPDVPDADLGGEPEQNWARLADAMAVVVTHTTYSRDAFLRAGVRSPVHVVPVPVRPEYFAIPAWESNQHVTIDCPCFVMTPPGDATGSNAPRDVYRRYVKDRLPYAVARQVSRVRAAVAAAKEAYRAGDPRNLAVAYQATPKLELDGVVFTTVFSPSDGRKNWTDLLSGFLLALRDCPDATLVCKLVVNPRNEAENLERVIGWYRRAASAHRCRLVLVTAYLTDAQMTELARASTFYVNTSHAEGSCLPLQDFLAAGRPAVAPPVTGMADALGPDCGYMVDAAPEPVGWPQAPDWYRLRTYWYRLNWQSLHDQYRAAYRAAKDDVREIRELGRRARERMSALASPRRVWPRLERALAEALACGYPEQFSTGRRAA